MTAIQKFISLKGHRELIASYSYATGSTRKWIVFLTESGSDYRTASRKELLRLVGGKAARKFNFLIVNKPGLTQDGIDKELFEQSFRRQGRIEDVLKTIKDLIPANHQIYLIGYSEGAYLAPEIALKDQRIKAVIMIGGGTRGWLKEELSNCSRKAKPKMEKKIQEIYKNKNSLKKWGGFSYATWYSYRGDNTLKAIHKLKIPLLCILGARDRVIDLKSTIVDLMIVSEKKNIHLNVYGDCGHYFSKHWSSVNRSVSLFLKGL